VKKSIPDLRGKSSGVQHPQLNSAIQIPKPASEIVKSKKPVQKRAAPAAEAPTVPKIVSAPAPSAPKPSREKVRVLRHPFLQDFVLICLLFVLF
jgi:hypothetical protein